MKKLQFLFLSLLLLSLFVFFAGGRHPGSAQTESSIQKEYVPNEVLVKFKKDTERILIQQAIDIVQGRIKTYLGKEMATGEWAATAEIPTQRSFLADPDLFQIKVPESVGTEQAIYLLGLNPNVEYAEPNYIGHVLETIPNDTHFSRLWGLRNTGQSGGTPDADIDATNAWDIEQGYSRDIVVAVIDTGIDYAHPDLADNIWKNLGEYGAGKENNNIDDDGNGFVDDWRGWDFSYTPGDNDPMDDDDAWWLPPDDPRRNRYHGTHVAGIIGAKGNNNKGIAGVCWNVKLMALKWVDPWRDPDTANAIRAIDYATYNGAHLSNNSWEIPDSKSCADAIERARANGKLFIAAAGNDWGNNNDYNPVCPASYDIDNVISVLATDHNDNMSPFSNFGAYSVDVGAPGGTDNTQNNYNIYSTMQGDRYQYHAGTSMAAPLVAGLAALIKAHRPSLNWWQVKTIIMQSVDPKSWLSDKCSSSGRVNAYNALTKPTPNLPAAPTNLRAQVIGSDVKLTWTDNSGNENGFYIYRKTGDIFVQFDYTDPNETTYWDIDLPPGTYCYYVRAYNQDGTSPKTLHRCAKVY